MSLLSLRNKDPKAKTTWESVEKAEKARGPVGYQINQRFLGSKQR